jgi:hypothetical protein
MAKTVHDVILRDLRNPPRFCALGHNDDIVPCPFPSSFRDQLIDPSNFEVVFGDKNDLGAA